MNNFNPYGLQESDLDALISLLKKNSKIDEIILFGSRAKGTFNNDSDIDLALKGSNLNLQDILDATLEIEKLLLPNKLDLIIFNRIKESSLTDHINRVGIVLYKKGKGRKAKGKRQK